MVAVLVRTIERAEGNEEEIVTILKAFGNAGLPESIQPLHAVIGNPRYSAFVRIQAILALRRVAPQLPRKVGNVVLYVVCILAQKIVNNSILLKKVL